jgi:SHS2 domain-containing protein
MPWEPIDHTGDIGIVARAPSLEALFGECASALAGIVADSRDAVPAAFEEFPVPSDDPAEALREFLAELLYRFSVERKMYVSFSPGSGTVRLGHVPYDPARHPLRTELKAVTWHQLEVTREPDGWKARVIFDV